MSPPQYPPPQDQPEKHRPQSTDPLSAGLFPKGDPPSVSGFSDEVLAVTVQNFLSSFPGEKGLSAAKVSEALDLITSRLSPEEKGVFLSSTLPQAVGRSSLGATLSGMHVLRVLTSCAENGSLAVTLPLVFRELPLIPLTFVAGRIEAIARSTGSRKEEVFNRSFPEVMRSHAGNFKEADFFAFQHLCESAREHTPEACDVLLNRLEGPVKINMPLVQTIFLIQEAGEQVSRRSAAACLNFCCDLAQLSDSGQGGDVGSVFGQASRAWILWGEPEREKIGASLVSLLEKSGGAIPVPALNGMLLSLTIEAERAAPVIQGSFALGDGFQPLRMLEHLERTGALQRRFAPQYVLPLTGFFATASACLRDDTAFSLFNELTHVFGLNRLGDHLPFLTKALTRFSDEEIRRLTCELPLIFDRAGRLLRETDAIDDTPLNYILTGILKGGADIFNEWSISEEQFYERWKSRRAVSLPPVLLIDEEISFTVPVAPGGEQVAVREGVALDRRFIDGRRRCFASDLPAGAQAQIVREIGCIAGYPSSEIMYNVKPHDVIPLLVEASLRCDEKRFSQAVRMSFPLLAQATGVRLGYLSSAYTAAGRCYDFLESLRLLINDRLPVTLERSGMARPFIDHIKKVASLNQIERELKKFSKQAPTHFWRVEMLAIKNVIDEFYDQLSETCILETCRNDLERPYFQPVRMLVESEYGFIGSWYTVRARVGGEPALIMAGGGPNRAAVKAMNIPVFIDGCLDAMARIGEKNGLIGVYTAVGAAKDGHSWTDEGRVAQYEEVIKALIPKKPAIIELDPSEWIFFPTDYEQYKDKGPLRRLIRLR